jgi:hypothetical protein
MIEDEMIELTTDSTLRGVNFEEVGLIIDEAQNCDVPTLRLILTRCHDNCHIAMLGDSRQKDNKSSKNEFIKYGDYMTIPDGNHQHQHNFHYLDLEMPYKAYREQTR